MIAKEVTVPGLSCQGLFPVAAGITRDDLNCFSEEQLVLNAQESRGFSESLVSRYQEQPRGESGSQMKRIQCAQ